MSLLRALSLGLLSVVAILFAAGLLALTLDLRGELSPRLERMATKALDRTVAVRGPVHFGVWQGGLSLIVQDVSLANAPWGTPPHMLKIGRLEIRAGLGPLFRREIAVRELLLDGVEAVVETQKSGKTNRPRPGALGGKVGLFGRMKLSGPDSLLATNVAFVYKTRTGLPPFGAKFERISIRPRGTDGLKLALLGTLHGKLFGVEATLADALALIRGRQSALEGAIAVGNSTVLLSGRVGSLTRGPGFALRLEGTAPDLRDFGALVGVTGLPEGYPVVFSAALNGAQGRVSLAEFSSRIGTGTIVGTLDISERNGAPNFEGVFASEVLDLEPFLGRWWRAADFSALAARPFALEFFRHAHIDVGYQAQLLRLGTAALEAADLRLLLAGGVLTLYPFSIYNDGEALEAELSIDFSSGGEGELRAITRRFPLGPLLARAGRGAALSGDLALSVELTGEGPSLQAMLADLRGQVSVALAGGALGAKALEYLPSAWRPVYEALGEGAPGVPLSCARGRALFEEGRAEARAFLVDTAVTATTGAARLDLATGQLSALLRPRAKAKATSENQANLVLEGPLADPRGSVVSKAQDSKGAGLPEGIKSLAAAYAAPSSDEPCTATFEGGLVPRVNDPTVITDPKQEAQRPARAAEGSEPW